VKSESNCDFPGLNFRIIVFAIIAGLVIIFYLSHLYLMQVIEIDLYTGRAERVSRRTEVVRSRRGLIYDRNIDEPLAGNNEVFVLLLNPEDAGKVEQIELTLQNLATHLGVDYESLRRKVPSKARFLESVELVGGLSFKTVVSIAENYEKYPGVSWETRSIRNYPYGANLAHLLGFIGDITPSELQVLFNRGYNSRSVIGKDGIEKVYDHYLQGSDGLRMKRVDAQGRKIVDSREIISEPVSGKNLVLTIDRHIQDLTVKALGPRIGAAIVMRPYNGEILAMVSYPSYNPNLFYSDQAGLAFSSLSRNSSGPFVNRTIQSADSPASTWKIVLNAAIYDTGSFSPGKTVLCTGSVKIGNRVFNCHLKTGHGALNVAQALAQSCNVYYYTVGADFLGVDSIVDYADRFGFGEFTGIDLPGEIFGLVPDPRWKLDVFKSRWVGGDTVNLSIGQGYLQVTPMQLVNMVSMIVNDGVSYQPHILKEVRDPIGSQVVEKIEPQILRRSTFKPGTLQRVREDMRGVITNGTAAPVFTSTAVKVAGKTGTAQTGRGDDNKHSWFVAYGPYDYKRIEDVIAVVVWVDGINKWEWWAPKAAHLIFHGAATGKNYQQTVLDLQPLWYLQPDAVDSISGVAQ
jgi:penicillin-binding protein 2